VVVEIVDECAGTIKPRKKPGGIASAPGERLKGSQRPLSRKPATNICEDVHSYSLMRMSIIQHRGMVLPDAQLSFQVLAAPLYKSKSRMAPKDCRGR
jgi:hypothetical protein